MVSSPVVHELRKQKDEAVRQIVALQGRCGPVTPDPFKVEQQRTEIDLLIQQEIGRVISNLRVQAKVARSCSDAVASTRAAAKTALA